MIELAVISTLLHATSLGTVTPEPVEGVGVREHLGRQLPGSSSFVDAQGEEVSLDELRSERKPILLIPAYYRCPMLCGLVLKGMAETVAELEWEPGEQYRMVTISFDRHDTVATALKRQTSVVGGLEDLTAADWPFLTGEQRAIDELLNAIGMCVERDPKTNQIAHSAVSVVLSPDGKISRYLYGIDVSAFHLKLALLEASEGKTGSAFDRVLMRCFAYDPATRKYGLFIDNFMRAGGVVLLVLVLGGVTLLFYRENRRRVGEGDE